MKFKLSAVMIAVTALACFSLRPAVAPSQQASTFPTFGQVDYFYAQNPQRFQGIWQSARSQTVRIAMLGDSQETSPGGAGAAYIPRVNYEMWKRYGNSPETPVEGWRDFGGGSPPADWLNPGGCATPGPSLSRIATDLILPNINPLAFSTLNGASNLN